ncbi:hypothetical protein ADEAN_000745300 [Angomonas deanei]|uniref:Uncharacterized protein n=1 Tax=Angomonas deanei TaxID=59799 RepID=A0A7G2CKL4_9TRYP|nr:hypothetical protein ADEAN_000745300 [Angomonas deanei]
MNRIELHARCNDENFGLSRRMYVLQPQDARQTLSVYELILRHVPRDTLLCSRVLHHAWEATPIVVNHLLQPLLTPETLRLTGFYMLEATEEVPLPIANTSATVPQSTINTAVQRRIRPAASNGDENRDRIDPNFFSSLLNETAAGDSSRLVFSYIEEERLPSLPGPSVPPAMFAVDTDLYDIQYGSIHQL